MYNLTVEETAERLSISTARVYQLIKSGALEATKIGRFWLVDDTSVEDRLSSNPQAGRPPKDESASLPGERYTLMNRTHPVLSFTYRRETNEFVAIDEVFDGSRAPLGIIAPRGTRASVRALERWWRGRCIPINRPDIREQLAQLELTECSQIPFLSYGFSLTDQYWIQPDKSSVFWGQLNFFHNRFENATWRSGWLANVGTLSPDNTTGGSLSKRWVCDGRHRWLYKEAGRTPYQGPYNEAVATALYRRLFDEEEYVAYELVPLKRTALSRCEVFIDSREEFIPASAVRTMVRKKDHHNDYQHYIEAAVRLGVTDIEVALSKMIVTDFLLANSQRHWQSFGLIRDVEDLTLRPAPLFNGDTSLWGNDLYEKLAGADYSYFAHPFASDPTTQLRLVSDYSWFRPEALDGFVEEAVDILSGNPVIRRRLPLIAEALSQRINRLAIIASH